MSQNEPTSLGTMLQVNARMGGGAQVVPPMQRMKKWNTSYVKMDALNTKIQINTTKQLSAEHGLACFVVCTFSMFCLVDYSHC